MAKEELWRLIGGTLRLRLTAHAIAQMPRDCAAADAGDRLELSEQAELLREWYGQLADRIAGPRGDPDVALATPPTPGDHADVPSRQSVWLGEHLDHLSDHLPALVEPAAHLAEVRRRPWWR